MALVPPIPIVSARFTSRGVSCFSPSPLLHAFARQLLGRKSIVLDFIIAETDRHRLFVGLTLCVRVRVRGCGCGCVLCPQYIYQPPAGNAASAASTNFITLLVSAAAVVFAVARV